MLQCPNCKYQTEEMLSIGLDEELSKKCPLCGYEMKETPKIEKQKNEIEDLREIVSYLLKTDGNDSTWQRIEELKSTKKRNIYRRLFFEFGGVVPKRHLLAKEGDESWGF